VSFLSRSWLFSRRSEGEGGSPGFTLVGLEQWTNFPIQMSGWGSWTLDVGFGWSEQWDAGKKTNMSLFVYPSIFGMGLGEDYSRSLDILAQLGMLQVGTCCGVDAGCI
jgi:hypothetical protein